jgi:DNA-binding IclR family transcriptional regulator
MPSYRRHATAAGKALLAFSHPRSIDRVVAAGLPAFTPDTITSPESYARNCRSSG